MRKSRKPLVRDNVLLVHGLGSGMADAVPVETEQWYEWLEAHSSFVFEGVAGHLMAQREIRRGRTYWYGYRRRGGKLLKTYLGRTRELTQARLEQASANLAGQTPLSQLAARPESTGLAVLPSNGQGALANDVDLSLLPMTQVTPPALPQAFVARPRLTERIRTPVTILCAPSGFGKSTVMNEWRQRCGMPVAWVALDADDNHPLRFWSKVVAALQIVHPDIGSDWLAQLRASSLSALSRIVFTLTNDILRAFGASSTSPGVGLVLDNYHLIHNTEIHTSLQTLLEHIPPTLRLVVASNTRPPLALGYLKAKGMVVELGAGDLRFTMEEGLAFLRQHTPGQPLAWGDMQALVRRTEGWVTGLVLAAYALAQQEDRAGFAATFTGTHPLLREFFMENSFRSQPPEVQTFLLKTSVLEYLSGPLCDSVLGQSGSGEILARLVSENVFLEQLGESDWYRYHGLFAEMLREQLRERFPAEAGRLHRRAAKWHLAQDDPENAVAHLLAGRSWEDAASVMERVALRELEKTGTDARLLHWLRQLPEAVLLAHKPLLAMYLRLAGIGLPPDEVDNLLTRMEASATAAQSSGEGCAEGEAAEEIRRVRRVLKAGAEASSPYGHASDTALQMLDALLRCHSACRRDVIQAETMAGAVYEAAKANRHLYALLAAGGLRANVALSQGHLRRSEQIATEVLREAFDLCGRLPEAASVALLALSNVSFMRNQLTQAQALLERAAEVNPDPTANEAVPMAILRAKMQSAHGDNEAASATIQAIRVMHAQRPSGLWSDRDLAAYQALFALRDGDVATAERLLSEVGEVENNPFATLVRGEILIEQARNVAAEDVVRRMLRKYPHGAYLLPTMRARVILAAALFNQRKMNQARQVMAKAARLAAPEFFRRPFLDYGKQIAPLLSLTLHTANLSAGTRAFLKGALTTLGYSDGAQAAAPPGESADLAVAASISPREQEVLQLLSAGLSNREIAVRLCISASTVKTHLENIYLKLGVTSRTQALAQAYALRLL